MRPGNRWQRSRSIRIWSTVGVLLLGLASVLLDRAPETLPGATSLQGESSILRLYQERRSGEMVEGSGTVDRILPDDHVGSRHQRFILSLSSGHTLLVSHNIDLASRIADLEKGDQVMFRGQYEWNDRGGVVHWTHHDPNGRRQGGWLQHQGETYR